MAGRRRRWHDVAVGSIPPEIIQRIALFISDTDTFFMYLTAFRDTNALGCLHHLLHLSKTCDRYDLWPDLHVYLLNAETVGSIQAVARIFPVIHFHHTFDMNRLHQCVTPSCLFTLHLTDTNTATDSSTESISAWYAHLARLPLLELSWERDADPGYLHVESLVAALPSMNRLQSLDLSLPLVPSIEPILHLVASSMLENLSLRALDPPSQPTFTTTCVQLLTQWLVSRPVRTLYLEGFSAQTIPEAIMAQFHAVLWSKPSLQALGFQVPSLPGLSLHRFVVPVPMSVLELCGCDLGPNDMKALCVGLQNSRVTTLDLTCNPIGVSGIKALGAILPTTPIEVLKLVLTQAGDGGCKAIALALPATCIRELHLGMNLITNGGAVELANVMRNTSVISTLRLQKNRIEAAGAAALIQMMGSRTVETQLLDLRKNSIDPSEIAMLEAMADHLPLIQTCALKKRIKPVEDSSMD
ncbi:hypothetical protein Ae201684P_002854 [Aphanomyces euteiches]|uniref:F-box domain-containing protein n=1 Tax=Aphanomyces euteiches TaxID=100861 RepID=A0A6G0X1J5_9STRA|nr:hypothetical protein Ae201684_009329 [Aphanomyces euteiches]KAH9070497.1 hypothetical protein Ae201684P_002854 [Aphanomyces euteiches]KAH9141904.1 hypothetical protein AeRB84_013977 [Aphanomyces euteiches]